MVRSPLHLLWLAIGVGVLASISWATTHEAPELTSTRKADLEPCSSPSLPIRPVQATLVWRKLLLAAGPSLALSGNNSGSFVAFDGKQLLIFDPHNYTRPDKIPLKSGLYGLAMSNRGAIAWIEGKNVGAKAFLTLGFYQHHTVLRSPPFEDEPWKVPQTWPELYFVGEKAYLSEQSGGLISFDSSEELKPTLVVPPGSNSDMTAATINGSYFQYVWKAQQTADGTVSSVTLFPNLIDIQEASGTKTPIASAVEDWRDVGDSILFWTNKTMSTVGPVVHLIRKIDGKEIAHLDYSNEYCQVTSMDTFDNNSKAAILLNSGLIQVVSTKDFRLLDQMAIPDSSDFLGGERIFSAGDGKFIVATVEGVALVETGDRIRNQ